MRPRSTSARFMCTQVASRSLMWRIHLPVLTERSPISSNTGSGASVVSGGSCVVRGRQGGPGRPLIIIPQRARVPRGAVRGGGGAGEPCPAVDHHPAAAADAGPADKVELQRRVLLLAGLVGRDGTGDAVR